MLFLKLRKKIIDHRKENWETEKEVMQYEAAFKEVTKKRRPHIETSKIILFIMILILGVVMAFAGYATFAMIKVVMLTGAAFDFTPLTALISAVAGEVVVTLGYFIKSTKENTDGGIVYRNMELNSLNDEDLR